MESQNSRREHIFAFSITSNVNSTHTINLCYDTIFLVGYSFDFGDVYKNIKEGINVHVMLKYLFMILRRNWINKKE